MLRDIYVIPENETRYDENKLEINDELSEIIQQIDMLLFTSPSDTLCMPGFGINLEEYLFNTVFNESYIKSQIDYQIDTFVYKSSAYNITSKVNFVEFDGYNVAMIVEIELDGRKILSYIV